MVHAYHITLSAYGFWLPNDLRGSWSEYVGSKKLYHVAGPATKTSRRESLAHETHDQEFRLNAKSALKLPPVRFTGVQARAIGRGFAKCAEASHLIVWACAILPEHVHLVIARHSWPIETIARVLKQNATRSLLDEQLHPFQSHKTRNGLVPRCWTRGLWKVFLNSEDAIRNAIHYVEDNPMKEGKPRQKWSFVQPFAGLA